MKTENLINEQLIIEYRQGNSEAFEQLFYKHRNRLRFWTQGYYAVGITEEDLFQEASLGFLKAVDGYKLDCGYSFTSFAKLNVISCIITVIKTARRKKAEMLNLALRMESLKYIQGESNLSIMDTVASDLPGPEEVVMDKLSCEIKQLTVDAFVRSLSTMEKNVIQQVYLRKQTYRDTAEILQIPYKSIDNAIVRIKRKAEKFSIKEVRGEELHVISGT